jgi:hypothetical protein
MDSDLVTSAKLSVIIHNVSACLFQLPSQIWVVPCFTSRRLDTHLDTPHLVRPIKYRGKRFSLLLFFEPFIRDQSYFVKNVSDS